MASLPSASSSRRDTSSESRALRPFGATLVFVALVLSSGRLNPAIILSEDLGFDVGQLILVAIFVVAAGLLLRHPRALVESFRRAPALAALVLLSVTSAAWSATPATTLARAMALCGATLLGAYIAAICRPLQLLRLLAGALAVGGILSVITVVFFPDIGIDNGWHEDAWQGIYHHKNALGRSMALCAIAWLLLGRQSGQLAVVRWLAIVASMSVLVMTDSATALAVALVVSAAVVCMLTLKWRPIRAVASGVVCLALAAPILATVNVQPESILALLGRDETLTGRTMLWQAVLAEIGKRPVIGVAYGGFWRGSDSAAGGVWQQLTGWTPNDAHNGFLDLWLDLGAIGAAVFLVTLAGNLRRAVGHAQAVQNLSGLWPMAFFTIVILYNLTESALLRPTNLLWIVYVALSCSTLSCNENDATTDVARPRVRPGVQSARSPAALGEARPLAGMQAHALPPRS